VIIERGGERRRGRCPTCRTWLSVQNGQFVAGEDDDHEQGDYAIEDDDDHDGSDEEDENGQFVVGEDDDNEQGAHEIEDDDDSDSSDEEDEEDEAEGEDEDEDEEFEDDGSDIKVSFSVQIRASEDEWFEDGEERFKEIVAQIANVEVDDVDVGDPTERRRPSGRSLKVETTITIDRSEDEPDCELEQLESDTKEFLEPLQMFEEEIHEEFEVLSRSEFVATCGGRRLRLNSPCP